MSDATHLLIVDDDAEIRELLGEFLEGHGYRVSVAADVREMRDALSRDPVELVILDVMLPGTDGLTALRAMKDQDPPVIMLSAIGTDIDRIVGLEMGAEDYLPKPCNPRELLARVRTVLRRPRGQGANADPNENGNGHALSFAGWRLLCDRRVLYDPGGDVIALSDGEFRLLMALAEHPQRVLTRNQLLDIARGTDAESYDRAIDVQMSRLRRKLREADPSGKDLIRTIRNEGYLFAPGVTRR